MAHFERELTDAQWHRALSVHEDILKNIDEKTKKAVSGTGGTYTPSDPIVLGGAGLELQCGLDLGSAGAQAYPGGTDATDEDADFVFGDDDFFRNESDLTRTIDDSPFLIFGNFTLQREAIAWNSVTNAVTPAIRTRRAGAFLRLPLRVPDGCRISGVEVSFKVGQDHTGTGVPAILPAARVVRIAVDGTIEPIPNQTNASHDPDGWVTIARPVSGAAYYNSGALQTLTCSYDGVSGPRVDRSTYAYAIEWKDERGTNAFDTYAVGGTPNVGNYLVHFKIAVAVPDLRPY